MADTTISGGPRITVSLAQVDQLNLEGKAKFANAADRTLFLNAVKNLREEAAQGDLDPMVQIPKPLNADKLGLTDKKLDTSFFMVGDAITDVLVLMHEVAQTMRQTSQNARAVARENEQTALKQSAQDIRSAAGFAFAAGLTSGIMTTASGVVGVVGAASSMKATAESAAIANNPEGALSLSEGEGLGKPDLVQEQLADVDAPDQLSQVEKQRQSADLDASDQLSEAEKREHFGDVELDDLSSKKDLDADELVDLDDDLMQVDDAPSTTKREATGKTGAADEQMVELDENAPAPEGEESSKKADYSQKQLGKMRKMLGDDGPVKRELSDDQRIKIKLLGEKADNIRAMAEGIKQGMAGAGQVVSAGLEYQSQQVDAQKALDDAKAKQDGYIVQDQDDAVHNARDMINDVRQKLSDIVAAAGQIESKIWS